MYKGMSFDPSDLSFAERFRDEINDLRQTIKYKCAPFRAYYKYRSWKYMNGSDVDLGMIRFLADKEKVSLDVGANLGLYSYVISKYSKHVHAYEPNPLAYRILTYVADANVSPHHAAITDQKGDVELVIPRNRKGWSNNGGSLNGDRAGRFGTVRIPGYTIDGLNVGQVGFIKIDIEGHELKALTGARNTLLRDRPRLLVENEYSHVGDRIFDVFKFMDELHYQGLFLDNGVLNRLESFDVHKHQINRRNGVDTSGRYVKNFIFIPK
jgi:FkbM family methyltransferase